MKKTLEQYQTEIKEKADKVSAIFDLADEKQGGECTKEQIDQIKGYNKEIAELEQKAADTKEGDQLREANERRREQVKNAARLPVPTGKEGRPGEPSERYEEARKSLGRVVLENEAFKSWHDQAASNGRIPDRTSIQTPIVQVKSLITGASDTSAGAAVQTDYQPLVNRAPFRPLTLMDLISKGETLSDLVEYAIINGYTNNAAPVAEATATTGTSGTKPESAMSFDKVQAAVKTIAHWIPATNRALADVAQLRTLIDTFLQFGLLDRAEYLMLNGDGTGENFLGILNTPGIQTQAYDTSILVTARKARTKVKTPGRVTPTAYLMNPLDWEAFDLQQDGEERFYFGGPSALGQPRLWGVPVVENEAITAGTALTGDFRYAMFWDRMQAAISVSNSHADFFIRNLVAILAESRAAFGVLYPKGFVSIDLTA